MKVTDDMIDPELRSAGRILRWIIPSVMSVRTLRRLDRILRFFLQGRRPRDLVSDEIEIPRRDGGRLRLMIYKPPGAQPGLPGVLWIHGGGYQVGFPDAEVSTYRRLIGAAPCVIVSPDYRLSTEAPYPAALDDCYDTLLWLKRHSSELGVRDDQIAVGGGSAGGGLTAAVTLLARDRGEVSIAFQMPLYPMIDDRLQTESVIDNDAPLWNYVLNENAWRMYLDALAGGDVPPYAAPARATDYRGLPPTGTFVGDVDPFRDETIEYVEQLKAAGVPVTFEIFRGGFHGFEGIRPNSAIAKRAFAFQVEWFALAVKNYFAAQR